MVVSSNRLFLLQLPLSGTPAIPDSASTPLLALLVSQGKGQPCSTSMGEPREEQMETGEGKKLSPSLLVPLVLLSHGRYSGYQLSHRLVPVWDSRLCAHTWFPFVWIEGMGCGFCPGVGVHGHSGVWD